MGLLFLFTILVDDLNNSVYYHVILFKCHIHFFIICFFNYCFLIIVLLLKS